MSASRGLLAAFALAAVGAAGAAALMGWYVAVPDLSHEIRVMSRQRCSLLVDASARPGGEVSPSALLAELERRGVKTPSLPVYPQTGEAPRDLEQWLRAYTAARKQYEARWDEIQRSPEYEAARVAVLERDRARALKTCAQLPEHS